MASHPLNFGLYTTGLKTSLNREDLQLKYFYLLCYFIYFGNLSDQSRELAFEGAYDDSGGLVVDKYSFLWA